MFLNQKFKESLKKADNEIEEQDEKEEMEIMENPFNLNPDMNEDEKWSAIECRYQK